MLILLIKISATLDSIKKNSMPTVGEHLTAKYYVDHSIYHSVHESSLLRLDPDQQLKQGEKDSIVLNSTLTSPKTLLELPTKSYVVAYMEVEELDVTYHQCLMIKIMNLMKRN